MALVGGAAFAGAFVARAEAQATKSLVKVIRRASVFESAISRTSSLLLTRAKKVRFYDDLIKDKIVVINFMYVKCDGVCPGITANLAKLQKLLGNRLGRDIFMYSFTLKPEQDSPEVLRKYAKAYHAKKGWTFLTGTPEDMELLRRKLGFTDPDPKLDADKSNHIGNVRYGNEALQLWGLVPGAIQSKLDGRIN